MTDSTRPPRTTREVVKRLVILQGGADTATAQILETTIEQLNNLDAFNSGGSD